MIDHTFQGNCTEHETQALRACVEVGKILTSTRNLKEILEVIMLKVSQLIEAQHWSLLLKDDATGELTFEIVVGISKELVRNIRLPPGHGIACKVAETSCPLLIRDAQNDPRFNRSVDAQTGFTTQSIICIPLKIHDKVLGVIEILNIKDMAAFESKDFPILTILSDYAAIAIENSQHITKIQRMSITDEYTGLYNARYLHQVLEDLIVTAGATGSNLAVVFVDIDNFKDVVDEYGHLLGSQVLKEVGETIGDCLSERDILIKYGGDEYIIILPEKSKEAAVALTQEILQAVRGSAYLTTQTKPVQLTASFGVAVYPDDADNKRELLSAADQSMYRVKRSTKNAVGFCKDSP